jgi:hypothetical protein
MLEALPPRALADTLEYLERVSAATHPVAAPFLMYELRVVRLGREATFTIRTS